MAGTKNGNSKQGQIPLLDDLPTEILIMIMKNCPNISSLWSLINASSRLNLIFMAVAREVVEYVITETAPVRVRNHMRIVLMIRTSPKSLLGIDDMVEYMSEDFVIGPMAQRISPQVLRDFVELAHIIHGIAHACLDFYVEKTLKDMKPRCLNDTEIDQVYKNKKQPMHKFDGLEGHPYQPACSGPPSYLEEQTAIRLLWRVQIFIELKAAWEKGTLAHWPEEELAGFGTMSMLDFLELSSVPGRGRSRLSYEQEQLFTLANFVTENLGEKPQEVEEELTRFLSRPPAVVYQRGFHLPCEPKPGPTMERMSGRDVLVDIDSEIGRAQMGWRFHTIMTSDVTKSPLFHFSFRPYRKFGFAFWQDDRMSDLGFLGPNQRWGMGKLYGLYFTWKSILTQDEIAAEVSERTTPFMNASGTHYSAT